MKFVHNNEEYELITLHVAGSRLYGNATEASDWDYRGVFIANPATKLGLIGKVEQLEGIDLFHSLTAAGLQLEYTDDIVLYELNRFAQLAIDNNPNIMDTLCHTEGSVYRSELGKDLLDNKALFLSTKLKHTFSGYAMAQMKKIKSHNKWINEFPDTDKVLKYLKDEYDLKNIDFNWIVSNFGGQVATRITDESADSNQSGTSLHWDVINKNTYLELDKYRIPRLTEYAKALNTKAKVLDKDEEVVKTKKTPGSCESRIIRTTINNLLLSEGSFRTLGDSMISLFTGGTGVFGQEGNVKCNEPKEVGEFVCLVRFDHHNYKKDGDHINGMWEWKVKRNVVRSVLEEQFGYDTKHASHLVRLMEGARDILTTGVYTPELKGESLQFVKDVRAGKYTYEWVLNYAEKVDKELTELYNTSVLQSKPNIKNINNLILNLLRREERIVVQPAFPKVDSSNLYDEE